MVVPLAILINRAAKKLNPATFCNTVTLFSPVITLSIIMLVYFTLHYKHVCRFVSYKDC